MTRAAFILAKEFGWTPQQVQTLTQAQVNLYLQLIAEESQKTDEYSFLANNGFNNPE